MLADDAPDAIAKARRRRPEPDRQDGAGRASRCPQPFAEFAKGETPKVLNPRFTPEQIEAFDAMVAKGIVRTPFNWELFFNADSRFPERAGLAGAITGTFYMLLVCFLLSFPIGIAAAVYLEEFAPKNRLTDLIEVNINNLAAVPSVVFGLLGLAVFLGFFGLPRSTPLVGGMVLSLDDAADHHHRHPRGAQGRAALDPRGGARRRRLQAPGHAASRAAAGDARHPDRHHHRHGTRAWARRRRCC